MGIHTCGTKSQTAIIRRLLCELLEENGHKQKEPAPCEGVALSTKAAKSRSWLLPAYTGIVTRCEAISLLSLCEELAASESVINR